MWERIKMTEKHYSVFTAQRGANPNWDLVRSIEQEAERNGSEIIILPSNGRFPSSTKADQEEVLHPYFADNYRVVENDLALNSNIDIRHFPVKAQQMDPTTSWDRFVAYDRSAIMPSPKQRMRVVPTSNTKLPQVLMSTGAITHPNYKDNSWGTKAMLDHVYGGIKVIVKDDKIFHYRQLRATKNGVFYDLAVRYDGKNQPRQERLEAMVLGDIHCAQLNPEAWAATEDMIRNYRPKHLMLHDLFDGYSINHHDMKNIVRRTQKFGMSLEEELHQVGEFLQATHELEPSMKIHIVKSNHDEVIDRYLTEGRFVEDPQNIDLALELFKELRNDGDPLKKGVEMTYGRVPKVHYMRIDEDFKIRGNQLGAHGHMGLNGARGSIRSFEKAYGKGVCGHYHVPEIFRKCMSVGLLANMDMYYNRGGASSWVHCNALIPKTGEPQLVNIIEGEYK